MIVFAVESSCDDTSVCILRSDKTILSHIIYTQEEHRVYGGVVPELASRSHLQILQKITKDALFEAKIDITEVDLFCATCGPGLIGGLLVGSIFTKSLSLSLEKPFIPINHLEGHLLSPTINNDVHYPFLAFLLTGGHTQIYLVREVNKYDLLGETLDDAIGEAFDKVAKLLGLPYPGGQEIEKLSSLGNPHSYDLPIPLDKNKNINFSFSGIKTAVNLIVKKEKKMNKNTQANIAASFQETILKLLERKNKIVFDYLKSKSINIKEIALVGGVAKNKLIQKKFEEFAKQNKCSIIVPPNNMLGDNAAMIGWTCIKKNQIKNFSDISFKPDPRLIIENTNI